MPVDLTVDGCQDSVVVDVGDVSLESLGRIMQLDVTIKNVCPNKRVALAAILTEVDQNGMEHQRGMKTMTIPAHNSPTCRDVLVKCIKFVCPRTWTSPADPPRPCATPATSRPGSSPTTSTPTSAAASLW